AKVIQGITRVTGDSIRSDGVCADDLAGRILEYLVLQIRMRVVDPRIDHRNYGSRARIPDSPGHVRLRLLRTILLAGVAGVVRRAVGIVNDVRLDIVDLGVLANRGNRFIHRNALPKLDPKDMQRA